MPAEWRKYAINICALQNGGRRFYHNLTGKPKQIIEKYKELYDIGLHGPDILFYYKPLFANPVNQVGYAMHDRPGIEFFRQASLVMQKAENKEACEAYIYGFCCHFALDVSCHGYIDEKTCGKRGQPYGNRSGIRP